MQARPVDIANRVVAELKATSFERTPASIERVYLPTAKLEEIGKLKVLVAVSGWRMAPDNREEWSYQIDVDVGVLYRAPLNVGVDATADFDAGMRMAEQIADLYRFQRTGTEKQFLLDNVQFGIGGDQPYLPEHIADFNQFTSVVRLTFLQIRGD